MQVFRLLPVVLVLLSCSGDAAGPSRTEVQGTYQLTTLMFDPQGSLPAVDLLARMDGAIPRLVLAPAGQAQLVFEDPETGLITTANGTYSTPQAAVRIDFGTGDEHQTVLLSRRMTFASDEAATSLTFDGASPDGVARDRLVQLVPEFADEQLLDPVPGQLSVGFTRIP